MIWNLIGVVGNSFLQDSLVSYVGRYVRKHGSVHASKGRLEK